MPETSDAVQTTSTNKTIGTALGLRLYPRTQIAEMVTREGPLETNPSLRRHYDGPVDLLRPTFYISASLGERPARLLPVLNARSGVLLWHLGRLTTYAVLGALAGAFGSVIPGPRWVPAALSAALLLWFAASLAGLTPGRTIPFPALARAGAWLARQDGLVWRYLFGLATGVLPCGLVYAALSMAVASAAPAAGAAAMAAFGLGTVPALAVLAEAVQGLARRGIWVRRALALLVLVAGLGSLGMRMARGGHMQHHMTAPAPTSTDATQAPAHGGGAMPDMPGR